MSQIIYEFGALLLAATTFAAFMAGVSVTNK